MAVHKPPFAELSDFFLEIKESNVQVEDNGLQRFSPPSSR